MIVTFFTSRKKRVHKFGSYFGFDIPRYMQIFIVKESGLSLLGILNKIEANAPKDSALTSSTIDHLASLNLRYLETYYLSSNR